MYASGKEKTKIALLIDNCPTHPQVEQLHYIKLIFMPQNTNQKNGENTKSTIGISFI